MIVFGADINKTNDKGETPRHLAASLKKVVVGTKDPARSSSSPHPSVYHHRLFFPSCRKGLSFTFNHLHCEPI